MVLGFKSRDLGIRAGAARLDGLGTWRSRRRCRGRLPGQPVKKVQGLLTSASGGVAN